MPSRVVHGILGLLFLTALYVCWSRLPFIWDGGYQCVWTLHLHEPYVYLTRFHTWILWQPLAWLSGHTENLTVLSLAFGLPFCLAPVASLAASWWVVKRYAPGLWLWAVLGICAAGLPGQVFIINDSMWQQTLFWPLFLGMLVPTTRPQRAILALFGTCQLPHQIGIALLAVALLAALVMRKRQPEEWRWRIAVVGGLFALAVAKTMWVSVPAWAGRFYDSYAAQQATWEAAWELWRKGVAGMPLAGLIFMWAAAALVAFRNGPRALPLVLAVLGGMLWIGWYAAPERWSEAIHYRRWVVPLAFPFAAFALLEAWRGVQVARSRGGLTAIVAVVFCVVLCMQARGWERMTAQLVAILDAQPARLVTHEALGPLRGSPIEHWGITTYAMLLQGKRPAKYLAFDEKSEAMLRTNPARIPLWSEDTIPAEPGPTGWFDHRPLVRALSDR